MKFFIKLILCCLVCTGMARADLYDISDIPISAEMASAQQARTAAISAGETDAFWLLMKKIVTPNDLEKISIPDSDSLLNMVQNVSLADEKTTATKYMATLTVRFHPQKVQDFLTIRQIPFLTEDYPVLVVIPVWQTETGMTTVLEEKNPLFNYLINNQEQLPKNIILPTGDLEDIAQARQLILEKNPVTSQFFKDKYTADRVWIIKMTANDCGGTVKTNLTEERNGTGCSDVNHWIDELWRTAVAQLEQTWREKHTRTFEIPESYWIQVPIKQLTDWARIQKKLSRASFLTGLDIRGFRPNEVLISLGYQGTLYELKEHFKTIHFDLTPGDSGAWTLTEEQQ